MGSETARWGVRECWRILQWIGDVQRVVTCSPVATWLRALKERGIKMVDMGGATGLRDLDSLQRPSRKDGPTTTVRRMLAIVALACIGVPLAGTTSANAVTVPPTPGYWLAGADGGVYSFGAPFYGSGVTPPGGCTFSPQPPSTLNGALGCDAIASTPSGNGYWLLNSFRSATAFGQAAQALQVGCTSLNGAAGFWTGFASSPTGNGFLVSSSNGGVWGCGDAVPLGGLPTKTLNAPVIGIAATPDGKGYWLAALDGGVFSFGDAQFYGSMGAAPLNTPPMVGIAATPDGKGYWLAGADGGVFSFGSAPFEGSMGGKQLNASVVGIATYAPPVPG